MILTENDKKLLLLTYDKWIFLAETGDESIDNWNRKSEVNSLLNRCGYCQIFMQKDEADCYECPMRGESYNPDSCFGGIFEKWYLSKTVEDRKFYAKIKLDRQKKYLEQIGIL